MQTLCIDGIKDILTTGNSVYFERIKHFINLQYFHIELPRINLFRNLKTKKIFDQRIKNKALIRCLFAECSNTNNSRTQKVYKIEWNESRKMAFAFAFAVLVWIFFVMCSKSIHKVQIKSSFFIATFVVNFLHYQNTQKAKSKWNNETSTKRDHFRFFPLHLNRKLTTLCSVTEAHFIYLWWNY